MKTKTYKIKADIGMMSLIGTGEHRPASWGNYFWFDGGPRVGNMWAENLETLVENGTLDDGLVEIKEYTDTIKGYDFDGKEYVQDYSWCIVIDPRIPDKSWLYNQLCFTGTSLPTVEILNDMYDTLGVAKDDECRDQYINPKAYWERRGAHYSDGCVSWGSCGSFGSKTLTKEAIDEMANAPRKLNIHWNSSTVNFNIERKGDLDE